MNNSKHLFLTILAVILTLLLLAGCAPAAAPAASTAPGSAAAPLPETEQESTTPTLQAVAFPVTTEDGELRLDALFAFDGINPDCGWEESQGIAAIKLVNPTGRHLSRADITLTMSDGTALRFHAEHIAPGAGASVFCSDNTPLPPQAQCVDIRCQSEFAEALTSDALTVEVNGMELLLTNTSGRDIRNIVLYCHNSLGDEYFGGIAYPYEINGLPAGESTTLAAADCLLGMAEVSYLSVIYE